LVGQTKGLVFGEYTVLDKIGAGSMVEVLKARHRRMKRIVAVKVLPAKAFENEDAVSGVEVESPWLQLSKLNLSP